MKKLVKPFVLLLLSVSMAFAAPKPQSFKVGMYNVQNSHLLKVFVEKKRGESMIVEIKNKNGQTVVTKYLDKKSSKAAICFDLEDLEAGNYSMEISNKNEVFVKEINLVDMKKIEIEKKIIL